MTPLNTGHGFGTKFCIAVVHFDFIDAFKGLCENFIAHVVFGLQCPVAKE